MISWDTREGRMTGPVRLGRKEITEGETERLYRTLHKIFIVTTDKLLVYFLG